MTTTEGFVPSGFDGDNVGRDRADCQRSLDSGLDVVGVHAPVQQQDIDQRTGPAGVPVRFPRRRPERVMGGREGAGFPGVGQGGRSLQRTRLVLQDLEVVVEIHALPVEDHDPRVPGDLGASLEDHDLRRSQRDPHRPADHPGGDGVFRHPHRDKRRPVNPGSQRESRVESFERQRGKQRTFRLEVLPHRPDPVLDPTPVVGLVPTNDLLVQSRQGGNDRHRGQVVPAEPSHLTLDAALLVGSVDAREAVERIEPVMGVE